VEVKTSTVVKETAVIACSDGSGAQSVAIAAAWQKGNSCRRDNRPMTMHGNKKPAARGDRL
jgi:hypothetical protein